MNTPLLEKLTKRIRHDILTMTTKAGSGHPTSSLSAVELMTVLFFKHLRYDMSNPRHAGNDRVIFSKGHASPLYYALYAAAGALSQKDLEGYRTFDSTLEGHPTGRFKYTEAATGSLGQGLSIGLGEALGLRLQEGSQTPRVFVLSGDGELAEGSVWESAAAASFRHVNNLFLLIDVNRLGQSDPTMYGHDISVYQARFESFGWRVIVVDNGNDLSQVEKAFEKAFKPSDVPTVILARTIKGCGVSVLEDADGWHGKPLSETELPHALAELGDVDLTLTGKTLKPLSVTVRHILDLSGAPKPSYDTAKPVATRKAFGKALVRLGAFVKHMTVIDGDVKNSTYTELFGAKYPDRFFELFIAEQNMAGVAVGLSARGFHPVMASFACFLSRAADQIRMAAFSGANIIVNGSHAGVSIGADGPSQMGLEDMALFRAVHGSTVLYPADAFSTEALVEEALKKGGIVYIRTTRPETPVLYSADRKFPVGGSVTHSSGKKELVTVVAAGVTLFEALKARDELAKQGIHIRVIDCYSVKPIDEAAIRKAADETKAIIVVEDHYPQGGLGDAVKSALAIGPKVPIIHLAVYKTPRSGKPKELLDYEGIAAPNIIESVQEFAKTV